MTESAFEITLSDPGGGNRLGPEARAGLQSQLKQARKSDAPTVLIRVSPNAWDQDPIADPAGLSAQQVSKDFHGLVVDLFSLETPVVVHLEGRVTGLGLALALACDIRFASPAADLGVGGSETPNALVSGTSWLLAHRAGSALVADLAWTGRYLRAEEAHHLGLLSGLSPDDSAARAAADRLAATPRGATSALKRSLNGRLLGELADQLDYDSWLATVAARAAR